MHRWKYLKFLLVVCLVVSLVTGCTGILGTFQQPDTRQAQCPAIIQAKDSPCLPANPQRVLTLSPDAFANAIALGITPIATAYDTTELLPTYLQQLAQPNQLIGDANQPDLEKILRLKPDLMIAHPWANIAPQLPQIAPTVVLSKNLSWQQDLLETAKILHREAIYPQLLAHYQQRISHLKARLGQNYVHQQISIAGIFPEFAYTYGQQSSNSAILHDLGLQRPMLQQKNLIYAQEYLSQEYLTDIDGDVLFVITRGGQTGKEKQLQQQAHNPLWSKLRAVQNQQVYVVGYHWHSGNYLSIMAMLDDIEAYLRPR
jgi:iron complex transport system substrate-binding protein